MKLAAAAWLLLAVAGAAAQAGPIDPNWVYVTPVKWLHAPKGIDERQGFAQVLVLYPEGQFVEVRASLIQMDKTKAVGFSAGDGILLRAGTWSRTDDHVIRIHSRDTVADEHDVGVRRCDVTGKTCDYVPRPIPGPWMDETCGLEGPPGTHLAQTIRCKRLIVKPLSLDLKMSELEAYTKDALAAAH